MVYPAEWNTLPDGVPCQMVYPAKWCTLPNGVPCQMGRLTKCGTVPGEVACQMTYPINREFPFFVLLPLPGGRLSNEKISE